MVSLQTAPFSASSSWNTPIPTNSSYTALNWPASTGYNYTVNWDSYSPSVYVASASDPIVQVSHPAGWGYPAGTVSIHMPAAAAGASGTDGELVVIDGDIAYNFWQFNRTSATTATAQSYGAENVVTGDGWGSKSPFLSAGITAVGASELGGLLVKAETDDGSIDHALQIAIDSKLAKSGFTGDAIAGDGGSSSGLVQEGQRLAIAPGTPMPAGLSALGKEVFTALQKYGAFVVDVAGGATVVRAQANSYDAATITALSKDMGMLTPLLSAVSTSSSGSGTSGATGSTGSTGGTGGTTGTGSTGSTGTDTTIGGSTGTGSTGTGSTTGTSGTGTDTTTGGTTGTGSTTGTGTTGTDTTTGGSTSGTRWHHHHHSSVSSGVASSSTTNVFGSSPTLGYSAADSSNTSGTSTVGDAAHPGWMSLFNQYAAAHFGTSGFVSNAALTPNADSAGFVAQTLTQSHYRR